MGLPEYLVDELNAAQEAMLKDLFPTLQWEEVERDYDSAPMRCCRVGNRTYTVLTDMETRTFEEVRHGISFRDSDE